jgi:hypothetical protein
MQEPRQTISAEMRVVKWSEEEMTEQGRVLCIYGPVPRCPFSIPLFFSYPSPAATSRPAILLTSFLPGSVKATCAGRNLHYPHTDP